MSPVKQLEVGDHVHDRQEDTDSHTDYIVVTLPGVTAETWQGPREAMTLAEKNPEYPADSSVVVTVRAEEIKTVDPDWRAKGQPEIPIGDVYDSDASMHVYPRPRVEISNTGDQDDVDGSGLDSENDSTILTDAGDPVTGTDRLLYRMAEELKEGGADVTILEDEQQLEVTKLGESYIVSTEGIEGNGYYRDSLESVADGYF